MNTPLAWKATDNYSGAPLSCMLNLVNGATRRRALFGERPESAWLEARRLANTGRWCRGQGPLTERWFDANRTDGGEWLQFPLRFRWR